MSPEPDPNLPTATVESASSDAPVENPHGSAGEAISESPSGAVRMAASVISAGTGAAVARAPEPRAGDNGVAERAAATTEPADAQGSASVTEEASATETAQLAASADSSEITAAVQAVDAVETAAAIPAVGAPEAAVSADGSESGETSQTMDQLMEQFAVPDPAAAEGEIFDGHVLAVTDAGVIVDVGGKFEGLVPASEFLDAGTTNPFGAGQTIEVERLHEHKDGYVLLSHTRAHRRRVWERIDKAYREHETIKGKVLERIKGGLVVDIGVRAFLPASQLELRPVHDLEAWKDRELDVRILKLNRKRGNIVVSHRAILEDEQKAKREALAGTLQEGSVVTGHAKNV